MTKLQLEKYCVKKANEILANSPEQKEQYIKICEMYTDILQRVEKLDPFYLQVSSLLLLRDLNNRIIEELLKMMLMIRRGKNES